MLKKITKWKKYIWNKKDLFSDFVKDEIREFTNVTDKLSFNTSKIFLLSGIPMTFLMYVWKFTNFSQRKSVKSGIYLAITESANFVDVF